MIHFCSHRLCCKMHSLQRRRVYNGCWSHAVMQSAEWLNDSDSRVWTLHDDQSFVSQTVRRTPRVTYSRPVIALISSPMPAVGSITLCLYTVATSEWFGDKIISSSRPQLVVPAAFDVIPTLYHLLECLVSFFSARQHSIICPARYNMPGYRSSVCLYRAYRFKFWCVFSETQYSDSYSNTMLVNSLTFQSITK